MRAFHVMCGVLCLIGYASAATPALDITDYFRTSITPAQGAPALVQRLAQTSDGFLWLGTPSGLYRFDGLRFERIDSVGAARLLGADITALTAPRSGGLWIGYVYGGVSFLNGGTLTNYPPQKGGLPFGTVFSLPVDLDGVVWAATSRGLARFDGRRWTDVTEALGLPSAYTRDAVADKAGNLWIASGEKIALVRRGSTRAHVYASVSAGLFFLQDPAGRVWNTLRDPACLYLLDGTRDDDPACRPLPAEYDIPALIDRSGNLWGTDTAGHLRMLPIPAERNPAVPEGRPQSLSDRPFISFGSLPQTALQDREGNLWFGTSAGLEQLRMARLRSQGPFLEYVVLGAGSHNSLWVGTTHFNPHAGADFFQLEDGHMVPYAGGPTMVTASYRDPTGVLWVGGYGRLWKLEDRTWKEIAAPAEISTAAGDPRRRVQAIARDASGAVWLSIVRAGLFKLQGGRWDRIPVSGIPTSDYPSVMYADAKGSVWLGYPRARIASLTHGTWHLYTESDGISVGNVQVVSVVNDQIWIGGDRGLARMRSNRFEALPTLDALGGVTGLLQGRNGDVWLSASIGAVRIPKQELPHLDVDPAKKTTGYETFDFLDGMPGVASGGRPLPTVLESDDGRIWFDVNDHYATFDSREHTANSVIPTVIIRSVTDDGRRRDLQNTLVLAANVRNIAIEYTATSLSIPSRVRFRYRLENFEHTWQDAGSRRSAYYNNLPPGQYTFRVIAANDAGLWNARGAMISLIIPAAFYQTPWFRVLCVAVGFAVMGALFLWRVRQVTARQRHRLEQRLEDRLNERTRIARELHDSLLQGFQGSMFRLQAVRQLLPGRPADAATFLDSALQAADQAIGEGRAAVQNLRSSTFDDGDLTTSLSALGSELTIAVESMAKPEYRVVVEGRPHELTPVVRDDAYRIVREAVRNAYQHANARHIEVEVTFGDADLTLRVRDDGIGVDPQILRKGQRAGHWGLPGMRERSKSFGGRLDVWSERNAGTEVELRIAARIAYAQHLR
jgi:signal transduction histidine kinase/ligand-binding sensor domain-containing protein